MLTLHKTWGLKLQQTANFHLFLSQSDAAAFEVFSAGSICVSSWLWDHRLIYKMCFYYTRLAAFLFWFFLFCLIDHYVCLLMVWWKRSSAHLRASLSRSFSLCLITLSHSISPFEDQKDALLPLIYSPHPQPPRLPPLAASSHFSGVCNEQAERVRVT